MSAARFLRPDSPWLWAVLFAFVGLCGVLIISPKYAERRERLDLQFQGRQRAMEANSNVALEAVDQQPAVAQSESTGSVIWFLGSILGGSMLLVGFAYYVFRGGYLRNPRMIKLQETEPATAVQSLGSSGSTENGPNSTA